MTEEQTEQHRETVERQEWQAPEIRRLDTRDAEAAGGTGPDTGVYS